MKIIQFTVTAKKREREGEKWGVKDGRGRKERAVGKRGESKSLGVSLTEDVQYKLTRVEETEGGRYTETYTEFPHVEEFISIFFFKKKPVLLKVILF